MGAPSELGPVDPQIFRVSEQGSRVYSAYSLVKGYRTLFNEAVASKGRLEPYLQQLAKYDIRDIISFENSIKLSEEIAKKILSTGMMEGKTLDAIKKKIGIFLDPDAGTISHGRSINCEEAKNCGLNIQKLDVDSSFWRHIYELYVRTDWFVTNRALKAIESKDGAFHVPLPRS